MYLFLFENGVSIELFSSMFYFLFQIHIRLSRSGSSDVVHDASRDKMRDVDLYPGDASSIDAFHRSGLHPDQHHVERSARGDRLQNQHGEMGGRNSDRGRLFYGVLLFSSCVRAFCTLRVVGGA